MLQLAAAGLMLAALATPHHYRKLETPPPIEHAIASWYYDAGNTACGFHAGMGVANRTLPCGTRVTFYFGGRSVNAVVDDRGPYVYPREWDLNQTVAGALGFTGVATVGYRISEPAG